MGNAQTADLYFKVASIVSPFFAATLAATLAYNFGTKAKKLDIMYANRIPALKEISTQLVHLHNYIGGVLAYLQGNEYAGNYHPPGGALQRRAELANVMTINKLFLSSSSRLSLDELVSSLSLV